MEGYAHKSEKSHKISFGTHKADLHQAKNIQKLPAINQRTIFIIPFFFFKIIKNRQKLHSSESAGCSSTWTPRWVFQTAQSPIYYRLVFILLSHFSKFENKSSIKLELSTSL